ncbi:50S ribosomal protein L24 [Candidatus Nitrosotenuis aquarius]|uniref:50S ribosomal protein L24 n=1 Tax=Candidatus Nitrosotenuis aquarius TaxID=1846278 RepID=UPI000C1F6322|nr:50S ribosomal protein L24 [Candidatus Nitrosotenuis aquarius]
MKPTTIRNRTIYQASQSLRSKLLCGHLSKDLKNKYHKRSVRVTEGDTVKVVRGEFKGVSGKVTRVSAMKNGVAVEGIKKEKLKGGNLDVFIHTSNVIVTDLNTEDKWRAAKLEGKSTKPAKEAKPAAPKPTPKAEAPKKEKQDKETKAAKPKKESK